MALAYIASLLVLIFVLMFTGIGVFARVMTSITRPNACQTIRIAFFHPFADGGGGGERVLWLMIIAFQRWQQEQKQTRDLEIAIYTGDTASKPNKILENAHQRFNLKMPDKQAIRFVYLNSRSLVEAKRWPHFTMMGQAFGSICLASEALLKYTPHVFIDTMGYAFTYPLARFVFGCRVCTYVHYPTISTDMLSKVRDRRPDYNNANAVTSSLCLSWSKLLYYQVFAWMYGLVGRCSSFNLVNSSWTRGHINALWRQPQRTMLLHPPCNTKTLAELPLKKLRPIDTASRKQNYTDERYRQNIIVSVAQFRPEKDHALQLRAFATFRQKNAAFPDIDSIRMIVIGGVRDHDDQERVIKLQHLASELDVAKFVDFRLNASFEMLQSTLGAATAAIHTMWNEHFGIGVVEFMAAGAITIAHNSGGPKYDIVIDVDGKSTGFLATTPDEYALALTKIFCTDFKQSAEAEQMRMRARKHAQNFSDEVFVTKVLKMVDDFIIPTKMIRSQSGIVQNKQH